MIDNYKDLTVGKYKELRQIKIDNPDAEDIDIQINMISVLDGREIEDIVNLSINEYTKLVSKLSFLDDVPKVSNKIPKKIKLGDNTYTILQDISKMITAQYIDYMQLAKKNDIDGNITEYLSVFMIPEGKRYNEGYDVKYVAKDIEEYLSIEDALNVCFFFRKQSITLIRTLLGYFRRMTRKMMRKEKNKEVREKMEQAEKNLTEAISSLKHMDGYITLT